MDFETYKRKFYVDPQPKPQFKFSGTLGISLYYEEYETVVNYYQQVLGPPNYIEGAGTRGWRIGDGWLTLFQAKTGNPQNVEVTFVMETPEEAEALHKGFIEAGGIGTPPSDELMYEPIRFCSVTDPFGTALLIISPLKNK